MDQGSMLFYLSKLQKCRTLLSHLYFPNLCLQAAKIFYDFTVFVISRIHGQQSFFYIFIYLKVAHLTGQMTLTNLGLVMYSLSLRDWSLFMQRWGGEKKKGGQGLEGGGLNVFIKKFRGVSSLIARYILRGVHWPRWIKQLNRRAQTIFVKQ